VRVGTTQLPVTLFTNPFAGEDMLDTAAYPLQFVLVPARVLMFGREDGELLASVIVKNGFMRTKANSINPALLSLPPKLSSLPPKLSSLPPKICTHLDIVLGLPNAILGVSFSFLINATKYACVATGDCG
jgi:hypothetical protein